jgi:protein SCO1
LKPEPIPVSEAVVKRWVASFVFLCAVAAMADSRPATGMILKLDRARSTIVISCDAIPGYMEAMVMPFTVRKEKSWDSLQAGQMIKFKLVVEANSAFADDIQIIPYETTELHPLDARRLGELERLSRSGPRTLLAPGDRVPDFQLIDQTRRPVRLSELRGRVVALSFMYTRCALPNYCFRLSNNLSQLQRRFRSRLGRDLILLTVTFDPVHDHPDELAKYAKTWAADPNTWHFLTGSEPQIRRVCELFGVEAFPDEGLLSHSLHTVVLDRQGKLAANLEGNQFSAAQLGDLVEAVMSRSD